MMREGLLKENIDGEALVWAHNRLLARTEQRKILMMISDGAPVDDSTLSVNPGNYLERHLREVIEEIETRSPVELIAIGIGHDVTRYYRRAVTIVDAEELGGAMTEKLAELFDEKPPERVRRTRRRSRCVDDNARFRAIRAADGGGVRDDCIVRGLLALRVLAVRPSALLPRSRCPGRRGASRAADASADQDQVAGRSSAFDPRDPSRRRFGALDFRGGLVLTSPHPRVRRHISGCASPRRRAFPRRHRPRRWLRGRIVYRTPAGRRSPTPRWRRCSAPTGARSTRARLVRHRGARRATAARSMSASSASTASCASTSARDGLLARGQPIAVPPAIETLPNNKGLECLAFVPEGAAARRHVDRDLRARPRCGRQPPGLPDRRHAARQLHGQAHRRFRRQRLRGARRTAICWCWSAASHGLRGVAMRIRRVAAGGDQAGRAGRRAGADFSPIWAIRSTTWRGSRCTAPPTAHSC